MEIAVFLESFQPEYWGGRETRWNRLIPLLSKDYNLTIFGDFSRIKPSEAFPKFKTMNFVDIGPLPSMYREKGNRSVTHALIFTWRTVINLKDRFDIVLIDQTPLISIPLIRLKLFFLRSKLVVVWHEVWDLSTWFRYSKYLGIVGYLLEFLAILTSPNVIVPSNRVRVSLKKKNPYSHIQIIPNGVDKVFRPRNRGSKKSVGTFASDDLNLLFVGRVIRHKNCRLLVQIMESAQRLGKTWKLTIVGDGPELNSIKSQAGRLGLADLISFKSNISISELDTIYHKADVFVFPSEREGFGISVAEALSKSIPVVIFDSKSNASLDLLLSTKWGVKVDDLSIGKWIAAIETASTLNSENISEEFLLKQESWSEIGSLMASYLSGIADSR